MLPSPLEVAYENTGGLDSFVRLVMPTPVKLLTKDLDVSLSDSFGTDVPKEDAS